MPTLWRVRKRHQLYCQYLGMTHSYHREELYWYNMAQPDYTLATKNTSAIVNYFSSADS